MREVRCRRSWSPQTLTETLQAVSVATRERKSRDCRILNRVRGARNPREGLCLAQGCLLPIRLTWLVGTLHMAAVLVRELRESGINKGQGELLSPTRTPQPLLRWCPPPPQGLTRKQSWGCTSTLSSMYLWKKWRAYHHYHL